ncbi:hypothetical protein GCM10010169_25440 [Micromonospora fulviviridis]|uniref:hypothetical protein n=1 Tax=Micromonospora fulviviridis TaxID=47860 RepID=UPI00166B6C04|nr:hypothetical protein [Micromonospora fulviviridis]GGR80182.1 hypothetical protein GCM10010169_25440 [Micromonospora fulviviridis]
MTQLPDWDVAIVDGQPTQVVNAAMVRALMRDSPLGEQVARQRLLAAGFPAHLLDEPDNTR